VVAGGPSARPPATTGTRRRPIPTPSSHAPAFPAVEKFWVRTLRMFRSRICGRWRRRASDAALRAFIAVARETLRAVKSGLGEEAGCTGPPVADGAILGGRPSARDRAIRRAALEAARACPMVQRDNSSCCISLTTAAIGPERSSAVNDCATASDVESWKVNTRWTRSLNASGWCWGGPVHPLQLADPRGALDAEHPVGA
jgi:hypothetical protein